MHRYYIVEICGSNEDAVKDYSMIVPILEKSFDFQCLLCLEDNHSFYLQFYFQKTREDLKNKILNLLKKKNRNIVINYIYIEEQYDNRIIWGGDRSLSV